MSLPKGYKSESKLIYGMRESHPGLFEIIINDPKTKNSIGTDPENLLIKLINDADKD